MRPEAPPARPPTTILQLLDPEAVATDPTVCLMLAAPCARFQRAGFTLQWVMTRPIKHWTLDIFVIWVLPAPEEHRQPRMSRAELLFRSGSRRRRRR